VVEKCLVDVADLFDIQCTEGQLAGALAGTEIEELERLEKKQDGTVVDRQWDRLGVTPAGAVGAPLKERETVRVEWTPA
jgi:hypothetical protein